MSGLRAGALSLAKSFFDSRVSPRNSLFQFKIIFIIVNIVASRAKLLFKLDKFLNASKLGFTSSTSSTSSAISGVGVKIVGDIKNQEAGHL